METPPLLYQNRKPNLLRPCCCAPASEDELQAKNPGMMIKPEIIMVIIFFIQNQFIITDV